jgi:hypothetical protein
VPRFFGHFSPREHLQTQIIANLIRALVVNFGLQLSAPKRLIGVFTASDPIPLRQTLEPSKKPDW